MFGRISRDEFDNLKKRVDWLKETHTKRAPWKYKVFPRTGTVMLDIAAKRDLDALTEKHNACVIEFTSKLQAICPHLDTTVEETEDVASFEIRMCPSRYSPGYNIPHGPYGRKTIETCGVCDKVLEDKFEEYVDQTCNPADCLADAKHLPPPSRHADIKCS